MLAVDGCNRESILETITLAIRFSDLELKDAIFTLELLWPRHVAQPHQAPKGPTCALFLGIQIDEAVQLSMS